LIFSQLLQYCPKYIQMAADHTEAARPAPAGTVTFGPPHPTTPAMLGDLRGLWDALRGST